MKIFCDTNVLVAAVVAHHPHHQAARPVFERVKAGVDQGSLSLHSLAESYAVLARLSGGSQIAPAIAWQLIYENAVKNFSLVVLTAGEYLKFLADAATQDVAGGMIYDALLLAAAAKSGAERIYTFKVSHFHSVTDEKTRKRIVAP